MSIRSELARVIAGKPKQPADPRTRGVTAGNDEPYSRFGKDKNADRRAKIKKWLEEYREGGPYADALDAYHLFALGTGYTLHCAKEDQALKDQVIAWCDQEHVDLDFIMQQGILSAKLAGDAYQEIVPTKDGKEVWGVITRDPSMFSKTVDDYDRVVGYTQYIVLGTGHSEEVPIKEIPVPGRRGDTFIPIINLVLDSIPGSVYGLSIWERAKDDIDRDCDIADSIRKAAHRHGTPKIAWQLGSGDDRASDTDIKNFRKEVEEMDAKTDMVVTHDTKPVPIDTSGLQNVKEISDLSLSRTSCSMGTPEEMMGMGRGSTEATATVRMQAFMKKIAAIQEIVSRTYNRQLIDRITGKPGSVWIQFNTMSLEEFLKLAEGIGKIRSGVDPDAVIDENEAREKLGLPPREATKETPA
jgi:hypothetical protein